MENKDKFFNHKVNEHKVGLTIHQSIIQNLCVIMYLSGSIPMGYCLGIKTEDLWNFNKTIYLASVYIFEDFRQSIYGKKMLLFWSRIAKKQGDIKWVVR